MMAGRELASFNLPPERAKENLNKMIDRIQAASPDCEIILQVMNPVIDRPEGDSGYPGRWTTAAWRSCWNPG